jgi:lipid II:glycine glycyltransferase (peptidoglycan interpeptide bridge formation enzyme)
VKVQLTKKRMRELLPTDILFQTLFWGRVKSRLGWNALAFDIESTGPKGDLLVLAKNFSRHLVGAYVPHGPESSPDPEHYGVFLEQLSEALKEHMSAPPAFIRYDLPWESHYAAGGVEAPEARIREVRMNFGTSTWNLRKAILDMTVADSHVVDIAGAEADILARMKPKTRYNIRLAERREVSVEKMSTAMLLAFYDLYGQTARRQGFTVCPYTYFETCFSVSESNVQAPNLLLLFARRGSDLLAGGIFAASCKTLHYLFGASSQDHRNLMGPYALHWAAIREGRALGCRRYDMGAISPGKDSRHPFYGLYRFKTGFGGDTVRRNGSWDYPLNHEAYAAYRNAETLNREMVI